MVPQNLEASRDAAHQMGVAEIEADTNIAEVGASMSSTSLSGVERSLGIFSSRMRTPSGLAKARRCSTEVIAASNLWSLNDFVADAQVLHQEAERNLFGDFERALDFVHGFDARPRDRWRRC